jgi:hypothetical protein
MNDFWKLVLMGAKARFVGMWRILVDDQFILISTTGTVGCTRKETTKKMQAVLDVINKEGA